MSAVTSSRLVSLRISWRRAGVEDDGHVGDAGVAVALAEQLDQLAAAGERVGVARREQQRQVGADAGEHGRIGEACGRDER